LLDLFDLSRQDFLFLINKNRKKLLTEKDLFRSEIRFEYLRAIDKIFNKGLDYYINPADPVKSAEESIFFRKDKFNADLNFAAKKIVNRFEEEKITISSISKLSDLNINRILPLVSLKDNPKKVAHKISSFLYPGFRRNLKEFLIALISKLADNNILVFEFVETWNKKELANIEGLFLSPNVIVLKRVQKALRREIFSLAHEIGHYLLDEEEIDEKLSEYANDYNSLSKVEKWCYDFAFYFLAQENSERIDNIENADTGNDYHYDLLTEISKRTNLSLIALYTRLLINKKISSGNYNMIRDDLYRKYIEKVKEEENRKVSEKEAETVQGGSTPKPIQSPLFIKTMQIALLEGIINEVEFCRRLNLKPEKLAMYLQ
jgi:Zn-dependent peptidase ImmA (M78 family)